MTGHPPFLHPVVVYGGAWRVVLGQRGGGRQGRVPGAARQQPCETARRSCACAFPVPGCSSLWTESCCWGGWLVRDGVVCIAVCGGLQLGAALINVCLDVGPLLPSSSSQTVAGCLFLGGFPVGRDQWGGERVVGGVLPRINIGTDVRGESSIMTGVYERWCSSTLHIRWGLCDSLCLVLVCGGRYCLGGGVLLFILGSSLDGVGPVRGLLGGGRRGWCEEWARSG
jgi:hypothetical protein